MRRIPLGRTGLTIPDLCLGTMTFGTQTPEHGSHAQIDMCLDHGLDFVDTAHVYPVNPILPETCGRSEEIIGTWGAKTGRRNDIIIATKHIGKGSSAIVGGSPMISSATIPGAVEASLGRLQTDVIDLYQLHWPNRVSYMFRSNWRYDPSGLDRASVIQDMADCLGAMDDMVTQGKIRTWGMSNESAWGMAALLGLAEAGAGPRVCALQNEYSLLCRLYDTDLAELSVLEDVVLLAFSPLAAGYLTGKYQDGIPSGSRMEFGPNMGGRETDRVRPAVAAYLQIAEKYGVDPIHMALAFCRQRPFPVAAIFGATRLEQLTHILDGKDLVLSQDALGDLDAAHKTHPMPF